MDWTNTYNQLKTEFPDLEIYKNHPLAPYTTLKIGGPADIFIHTKTSEQLIKALNFTSKLVNNFTDKNGEEINFSARNHVNEAQRVSTTKIELPSKNITILGNGSNVLISDLGVHGIVIKNSSANIEILEKIDAQKKAELISAHRTENEPTKYLDFSKLDYDESDCPKIKVKIDSGVNLPFAINELISKGVTGLQWFAYIPGTVGGAVFGNIHGGKYHFSDYIDSVETFDLNSGDFKTFKKDDLTWDYDHSYFQSHPNLIIISVTLNLYLGDSNKAKLVVDEWIKQKSPVQQINSAGSVFKNPNFEDCQRIWGEQKSAGWIIDHELNLKGKTVGQAQISPTHANFIVNLGNATAKDYLDLVKLIQSEASKKFNLELEPEIKMLGEF
jgi:UDP-N-acetylmuramate dehydrogenase